MKKDAHFRSGLPMKKDQLFSLVAYDLLRVEGILVTVSADVKAGFKWEILTTSTLVPSLSLNAEGDLSRTRNVLVYNF